MAGNHLTEPKYGFKEFIGKLVVIAHGEPRFGTNI
jgi:hypothetical protein